MKMIFKKQKKKTPKQDTNQKKAKTQKDGNKHKKNVVFLFVMFVCVCFSCFLMFV